MVPAPSAAAVPAGRRRPKDRKAQIARVAAETFSALGYHAVSMEAIAAQVGISGPALYRHYGSKYELFAGAVLALGQQLVEATDVCDTDPEADPATELDRMVAALIELAVANRESGGLYRWHARYLSGRELATLWRQVVTVNHRIHRRLTAIRPSLTSAQQWLLSVGLLSIIGSIVDHRVSATPGEIDALFTGAASALLAADLPAAVGAAPRPVAPRIFAAQAGAYEALLQAAMVLFNEQGYPETSMAQIAAVAGVPASGIYRYFSAKSEILVTGLRRAADRISGDFAHIMAAPAEPHQTLTRLVDSYVATSFANPEVASIYYTERVNLPAADQTLLRQAQRSTIDAWVQLLTAQRAELSSTQARFLVHAAMGVVVDLGRLLHYERLAGTAQAYPQACVRTLMGVTLFGRCE